MFSCFDKFSLDAKVSDIPDEAARNAYKTSVADIFQQLAFTGVKLETYYDYSSDDEDSTELVDETSWLISKDDYDKYSNDAQKEAKKELKEAVEMLENEWSSFAR